MEVAMANREMMMADVLRHIERDVHNRLLSDAVQIIYYVATGKVMCRDYAEKFGLAEADVRYVLDKVAIGLDNELRKLRK